jgi:predicted amino acid dehydrogenase
MMADAWRLLLTMTDVRRAWRVLTDRPHVDVAFITNLRDEAERRRFFHAKADLYQHASGPRMHLGGVTGEVRGINVTAEEILTRAGRKRARAVFMEAVAWAHDEGARVVLLAAATKRLFGHDGAELKARFPDMVFTIGDNGTAHLLCQDVERAMAQAGLDKAHARVLVVGAYGHLGRAVSRHLMNQHVNVVGYGPNLRLLEAFSAETGTPVSLSLENAGFFDMVITCTHSVEAKLTPTDVSLLRQPDRKLLVVDVAEPANLDERCLAACRSWVVRQDAGNAYAGKLSYLLGPLSYRKLRLPARTVFGCFAEAMALHRAIFTAHNPLMLGRDWFDVNPAQMALVAAALEDMGLGLPAPHCFGQPVGSFDLGLQQAGAGGSVLASALPYQTPANAH